MWASRKASRSARRNRIHRPLVMQGSALAARQSSMVRRLIFRKAQASVMVSNSVDRELMAVLFGCIVDGRMASAMCRREGSELGIRPCPGKSLRRWRGMWASGDECPASYHLNDWRWGRRSVPVRACFVSISLRASRIFSRFLHFFRGLCQFGILTAGNLALTVFRLGL